MLRRYGTGSRRLQNSPVRMSAEQELNSLLDLWSVLAEEYAATGDRLLLDCLSGIKQAYEELSAKEAKDRTVTTPSRSPAIIVRIRLSK